MNLGSLFKWVFILGALAVLCVLGLAWLMAETGAVGGGGGVTFTTTDYALDIFAEICGGVLFGLFMAFLFKSAGDFFCGSGANDPNVGKSRSQHPNDDGKQGPTGKQCF